MKNKANYKRLLIMSWSLTLFVGLFFFTMNTDAQVGINTQNPQRIFHIDPLSNNNKYGVPALAELSDDVVVGQTGNILVWALLVPKQRLILKLLEQQRIRFLVLY